MEKEPNPVAVAGVTLLGGIVLLWLTRAFLSDKLLLVFVIVGCVSGAALVATHSSRNGGAVIRGVAGISVVAGFVRSAMHTEGHLDGGFTAMGGILLGIAVTQFVTRRFEHPWMKHKENDSK